MLLDPLWSLQFINSLNVPLLLVHWHTLLLRVLSHLHLDFWNKKVRFVDGQPVISLRLAYHLTSNFLINFRRWLFTTTMLRELLVELPKFVLNLRVPLSKRFNMLSNPYWPVLLLCAYKTNQLKVLSVSTCLLTLGDKLKLAQLLDPVIGDRNLVGCFPWHERAGSYFQNRLVVILRPAIMYSECYTPEENFVWETTLVHLVWWKVFTKDLNSLYQWPNIFDC